MKKYVAPVREKIMNYFMFSAIIFVVFCLIYVMFLMFYPVNVIDVKEPLILDKTITYPGDTIFYTIDYCKYGDIVATGNHLLVNDIVVSYSERSTSVESGCHIKTIPVKIPDFIEEGTYHIETILNYRINSLKTIKKVFKTENFTIERDIKYSDCLRSHNSTPSDVRAN